MKSITINKVKIEYKKINEKFEPINYIYKNIKQSFSESNRHIFSKLKTNLEKIFSDCKDPETIEHIKKILPLLYSLMLENNPLIAYNKLKENDLSFNAFIKCFPKKDIETNLKSTSILYLKKLFVIADLYITSYMKINSS